MLNPPNSISLLRGPLALLFLSESLLVRALAVFLAMLTDCIDGYLARRYQYTSRIGAVLDPIMDKFFVFFVLAVFIYEKALLPHEALLMISRDLALCVFALFLAIKGDWKAYRCRAVRWGKVTTAMQFAVLMCLVFSVSLPYYVYWLFAGVGILVLVELLISYKKSLIDTK